MKDFKKYSRLKPLKLSYDNQTTQKEPNMTNPQWIATLTPEEAYDELERMKERSLGYSHSRLYCVDWLGEERTENNG